MPYPIFLDLSGRQALVVGAGRVGGRKIAGLAGRGLARILALDPARPEREETLACGTRVEYRNRPFSPEDLAGMALAFACANDKAANAAVIAACRERGVLCNAADAPEHSDFFVPSMIERGDVFVAVSTGGAGPALCKRLREELDDWLGNRYTAAAALLRRLRPALLELGLGTAENTRILRALAASPLAELLAAGKTAEARDLLRDLLCALLPASLRESPPGSAPGSLPEPLPEPLPGSLPESLPESLRDAIGVFFHEF